MEKNSFLPKHNLLLLEFSPRFDIDCSKSDYDIVLGLFKPFYLEPAKTPIRFEISLIYCRFRSFSPPSYRLLISLISTFRESHQSLLR